ncbi:MAG TPA: hypothetical protein VHK91_17135, partial [Flavisolibacter sp.]|nr:hypothetical protein [Flavisolibacter sp.]
MRYLLLILMVSSVHASYSQDKHPLRQGEVNRVLNKAFNKLVSGNPNPGEVANYATLDPVKGTFNAKGTIPLNAGIPKRYRNSSLEEQLGKDSGSISYLSFSVSGGLNDQNIGTLFSNSSLNTGINLGVQYNFRPGHPLFSYQSERWQKLAAERDALFRAHTAGRLAVERAYNDSAVAKNLYLLNLKLTTSETKLAKKQTELDLVQKTVDSLGTGIRLRTGLGDTLQTLVSELTGLQNEVMTVTAARDSVRTIDSIRLLDAPQRALAFGINSRKVLLIQEMKDKLKDNYDTLLAKAELLKIQLVWFTISGGYSRQSFSTFEASLPFTSQIGDGRLDGYNFGAAVNYLSQNLLRHRTFFLNGGVSRVRGSNLSTMSTTLIEQARAIKSVTGDTVRTLTNKYNAYTKPVEPYMLWNLSVHAYYVFGKTPSGVHLFPSFDFSKDKNTVANLTLGYLVSFQNTKDKTVLNSELYIRFEDLFQKEAATPFHRRNEIGLS